MPRVFLLCLMVLICFFRIGYEQAHWAISFLILYGLSFYIDTKSKIINLQKISLAEKLIYLFFIPVLLSGIVIRPAKFILHWRQPYSITQVRWNWVTVRICRGLFEKFIIAAHILKALRGHFDQLEPVSDVYHGLVTLTFVLLLLPAVYFEISGTTNIARAFAEILGLKTSSNFISPWRSKNLIDYWQRWNTTISAWVRDYLFFSCLSSKTIKSFEKISVDVAIVISFSIFGIWHGLTWPCFVWGLFHGLTLAATRHWFFLANPNFLGKILIYIFGLSVPLIALFVKDFSSYVTVINSILKISNLNFMDSLKDLTVTFSEGRIPLSIILAIAVTDSLWYFFKSPRLSLRIYRFFSLQPIFLKILSIYILGLFLFSFAEIAVSPYLYLRY